jgi:hypothetical protein
MSAGISRMADVRPSRIGTMGSNGELRDDQSYPHIHYSWLFYCSPDKRRLLRRCGGAKKPHSNMRGAQASRADRWLPSIRSEQSYAQEAISLLLA